MLTYQTENFREPFGKPGRCVDLLTVKPLARSPFDQRASLSSMREAGRTGNFVRSSRAGPRALAMASRLRTTAASLARSTPTN